jgi:hypothetical protein
MTRHVEWTMGPPAWPGDWSAALESMRDNYRRALDEMRIPYGPGQCAPAIGVHQGCEHDR